MKVSDLPATEVSVHAFLADQKGKAKLCGNIAHHFGVSHHAMHFILCGLVQSGMVRKTAERTACYYVPTAEQLEKMRQENEVRPFRPLKVDRARRELHEEIRAERAKYPSIG